ncbi:MAG: DMT family transporter [Gemmatimonadaceae bacterium]|jgi:drug/metabolite transporter (DMT)-like permease|nr:DMT family transporter [Gemmatimonadaceae bacterium]
MSPLTALATADNAPLPAVLFWRYVTSAVVLGLLAAHSRRTRGDTTTPPWRSLDITLLGGGAQFAIASLSLSALRYLPAAAIGFLFYTFPAWVTIGSAVRGLERLTVRRVVALVCALGGIVAMVGAPGAASLSPTGVALALAAAAVYALYIPIMGTRQRGLAPRDVAFAVVLGGTMWFLGWCLLTGALWPLLSPREYAIAALMGVLAAGAFFGFMEGLAGLGAVRTAITSTVEPLWTVLLGLVLLQQPLGVGTLLGGAGVMAAVVLLSLPERSAPSSPAPG